MDIKSEALASATATLRQSDGLTPSEAAKFANRLSSQALLADQSAGTAQQHLKWSAAAKEWLSLLQELLTATQVFQSAQPR